MSEQLHSITTYFYPLILFFVIPLMSHSKLSHSQYGTLAWWSDSSW